MDTAPNTATNPAALFQKLAIIMGQVTRLKKTGRNNAQNYAFATDADVLDTLRPMLAEQHIAFFASMVECKFGSAGNTSSGKPQTHVKATFEFILCCGDTGVTYTSRWTGEAIDSGDKAVSKAATSALKYWLLKTFMMSTGDTQDDPDVESPERDRRSKQNQKIAQNTQNKPVYGQKPNNTEATPGSASRASEVAKTGIPETPNAPKTSKWEYDRNALRTAIANLPIGRDRSSAERDNTIDAMFRNGDFNDVGSLEGAVAKVTNRFMAHDAKRKGKQSEPTQAELERMPSEIDF